MSNIVNALSKIPLAKTIKEIVELQMRKNNHVVKRLQNKFYCLVCQGRGYVNCRMCRDGCNHCDGVKYVPCISCSGLGFNGYTYF